MVRAKNHGPEIKTVRSCYRNQAAKDCKTAMNDSKKYFIQNYLALKKIHGCSIIDIDSTEFKNFCTNVNGYYKSRMKQIRRDYLGYSEVKNVKEERQWKMFMNILHNAFKQGKEDKVTALLYDMSQIS